MAIISLSPTGFKVLQALNTYRFLTVKQMLRLGVGKDPGNLRKVLAGMVSAKRDQSGLPRPKEIGLIDFGVLPGVGRLSRLYFLAPQGAERLNEVDPEGPTPRPTLHALRFQNDYFHRVNTVDFHITLAQFAAAEGHDITQARQYFNRRPKEGKIPPRPSTSIDLRPGYIDPDSIFMLRDRDGTERLLLVEIANGHKVERVVSKLAKYGQALASDMINLAFNYGDRAPRVLWLFEHQRTLELIQKRAVNDPWVGASLPYFFLKTLEELTPGNFVDGWQQASAGSDEKPLF